MTIEDALYSRLSVDVGLNALIAGRVYPLMAPQGVASPYLVFLKVVEQAGGSRVNVVEE